MNPCHALICVKRAHRCFVGAYPIRFDLLVSHGTQFCPREPLNTTQLIGEAL